MAGRPGAAPPDQSASPRAPRRLVLLQGDNHSEAVEVLLDYREADISGFRLHKDLQRLAAERPGKTVAAEWLAALGWTRFLWCRK